MRGNAAAEYQIERGDVLLSIHLVLIREAERREAGLPDSNRGMGGLAPRTDRPSPREHLPRPLVPAPLPIAAEPLALPVEPAPEPAPVGEAASSGGPDTWAAGLVDEPTGAAGVASLRRDLVLERDWPSALGSTSLVAMSLSPDGLEGWPGRATADVTVRLLVKSAHAVLGSRAVVYRTALADVVLLIQGLEGAALAEAVQALSASLNRRLSAHSFPLVELEWRPRETAEALLEFGLHR